MDNCLLSSRHRISDLTPTFLVIGAMDKIKSKLDTKNKEKTLDYSLERLAKPE